MGVFTLLQARWRVMGDVLESLKLIHTRLAKLEDKGAQVEYDESAGALVQLPRWLKKHHEWEMMKQEFLTGKQLLGAKFQYSSAMLAKMNAQYNKYWTDITGRNVKFQFSEQHVKFLTLAEPGLKRNLLLQKYLVAAPTILEPFAGCGGDTVTFLYNMKARVIYASDMTKKFEKDYIKANVNNFQDALPETKATRVVLFNKRAADFFRDLAEEQDEEGNTIAVHIDVLYLDPPWVLPGKRQEATPEELLEFLIAEVFEPLFERGFTPKVIVVKTRFGWKEMSKLMDHIKGFSHRDTLKFSPLKREVNFHILTSDRFTVTKWEPSEEYKYIYKGGQAPALPEGDPRRAIDFGEFTYDRTERQ